MTKKKQKASIYQFKVTLRGSKPPIWRRIQVNSDTRLSTFHDILQTAMGWMDTHLHQFIVDNEYYGEPDPEFDSKDEHKVKLDHFGLQEKSKFIYEYDFGDSWEHEILLEKILEPEPEGTYPFCLKGSRACPPEDCGGIWGYAELLEAIQNPKHPDHSEMLDWVGNDFDPEECDLDQINHDLKRL